MGNFIKKNWFVCLLVVLLAGVSTYYIYDTNKGKLKGKSSGGEDVLYEINGEDTTTGAFYDELYKTNGTAAIYNLFERTVANAAVTTTDTMKNDAKTQSASIISNYQQYYPTDYQEQLGSALKQMGYSGYDDLQTYLIDYAKEQQITSDYAKANFDDLKIRSISYILVKFTDSANVTDQPTEDEAARMQAVDDELASGASFEQTAADHSEDTSTSTKGGYLGVIDKNTTSLDATFMDAALKLGDGEVSGWVKSASFGYFKIKCNACTADTLEKLANSASASASPSADATASAAATAAASAAASPAASASASAATYTESFATEPYTELVSSYDTTLANKALWEKAQSLGVDFKGNDDLKTKLLTYMGIEDSSAASASASPEASAEATAAASASAEATAAASATAGN